MRFARPVIVRPAFEFPLVQVSNITDLDSGSGAETFDRILVDFDTGSGSDAFNYAVASSDTGSGTEASLLVIADSDTGSGADAQSVVKPGAPSAIGVDTEILTVPWTLTDTGSGADAQAVAYGDNGSGVDTENILHADADTGSGAEVGSASAGHQFFTSTDTGSGTDPEVRSAAYTDADAGSGADGGILIATSGRGLDTETLTVQTTARDFGFGAEAQTLVTTTNSTPSDLDTAVGSDTFDRILVDFDSGSGVDLGTLPSQSFFVVQDSGGSISRPQSSFTDGDTGHGNEGLPGQVGPLYFWWGYLDWGATLTVTDTETAVATEFGLNVDLIRAQFTDTEAPVSVDAGAVTVGGNVFINDSDAGSGVDVGVLAATPGFFTDTDVGSGTDTFAQSTADTDLNNLSVESTNIGIAQGEFGLGLDFERVLLVAADTGAGADTQSFLLTSTDTGSGADSSLAITFKDGDTGVGTDTFNFAKFDADAGAGLDGSLLAASIRFIDTDANRAVGETTRILITQSDTGAGTENINSSNDNGFGVEAQILKVVGLVGTDSGHGTTLGTVSLPTPPDLPGVLVFTTDSLGSLAIVRDTAGALTMNGDTAGTLTNPTVDTPGVLVFTPIGDRSE